jgi:hypothetical protein
MSNGPDPGSVIVAIFLILFGACFALAGGGCTLFLVGNIGGWGSDGGLLLLLLLLSLGALGIGLLMIRGALKLLGPRD